MNREMKIGLVLGILLVGIVAALFFRPEPVPRIPDVPGLKNVADIDAVIQERPHAPYLTGAEPLNEQSSDAPESQDESQSSTTNDDMSADPISSTDTDDLLSETDFDESGNRSSYTSWNDPEPSSSTEIDSQRSLERYAHNDAWESTAGNSIPEHGVDRHQQDSADAGDFHSRRRPVRKHTIQPGDTLSALASRYLGSSRRLKDLYEANREILSNPDHLPVGMTITIPNTEQTQESDPLATRDRDDVSTDGLPEDRAERPSIGRNQRSPFLPVSQSPFAFGRSSRSTSQEDASPADAGRRSTQRVTQYTVQRGDTLEGIARRHYGTPSKTKEIFRVNRDQLSSPDTIREGMILYLP